MAADAPGWRLFSGDASAWDAAVEALRGPVYQTSSWAEHKAASGWTPLRALDAGPDGAPRAAVQVLRRTKGPAALLWARGGPLGEPARWDEAMRRTLAGAAGRPAVYLRVSPYHESDGPAEAGMKARGWRRPARPLDRAASFILDLAPEEAFSSNWAHNLRRAQKRCAPARAWPDPDPAEVARLYRAMESYKGVAVGLDDAALATQLRALSARLVLVRVDGPDGAPLAMRAAALCGGAGWDLLAAASPEGRRCYASYGAFWALTRELRARGAAFLELGGADPELAKGVHDFKRGTGARPVQYLGEWDWARPAGLRRLAGLAATRLAEAARGA